MYTDSHAHLSSDDFSDDELDVLLKRALDAKVTKIVNICTDKKTLERGLDLSKKYPWIVNSGSTTPHDVDKEGETFFSLFESAAREKKLVAVGETGLDYHYEYSNRETQKEYFIKYMHLSLACELPLIIHCREAFADLFTLLKSEYKMGTPFILHCFTGTLDEAKSVLDLGGFISLSGIVTFKKSFQLKEVAKFVPLDRLLIETDSPYLAPQSHRGKKNEPSFLFEVAATIADLKGITSERVAHATTVNAAHLFSI